MALALLTAPDEGRVQGEGNRRGGGCRLARPGVAQVPANLQRVATHAFVADPAINRQKLFEHPGRDTIGQEGGKLSPDLVELRS